MTLPGVTPPTLVPEAGVARYISIPSRNRFFIPLFLSISRHNLYRCSSFCIISLYVSVSGILMPGQPFYSGSELSRSSRSPEVSALDPRPQRTRQSHHLYDSPKNSFLPLPAAASASAGFSAPLRLQRTAGAVYEGSYAHYHRSYGDVGAISEDSLPP